MILGVPSDQMDGAGRRSRSPERESFGRDEQYEDQGRMNDPYRRRSPRRYFQTAKFLSNYAVHGRTRGGRARSRSPNGIDRYTSRRDFPRRDESPRRRLPNPMPAAIDRYVPGQEPPAIAMNPQPHPLSYPHLIPYPWFVEWWRKEQEIKEEKERQKNGGRPRERLRGEKESREEREKERIKIQADYDEYKEKCQSNQSRDFVNQHKSEEWFKERYDPQVRDPIRQRLAEFRKENYHRWASELAAGAFDDVTLEGIYKSESNGTGGVVEKEEGETTAIAEVLGVGDLIPVGPELQDKALTGPTLLIKTIAPHVSREQLEDFCKEHLGGGPGGLKWLSLSEPNPGKKCHRVGWIMLHPGDNPNLQEPAEDHGDGIEEDDTMKTEVAKEGPATRACRAIDGKSITDEEKGNFTCHVGVHYPANTTRKKALWDLFAAAERVEKDLQLAQRLTNKLEMETGQEVEGVNRIEERVEHLQSSGRLRSKNKSDNENGIDEMDVEEGAWDDDQDDEPLLLNKKKLDLIVEYLRRVFNFCLFCVFEGDSVHELVRKCPGGHLRRPRATLTSSAKEVAKASADDEPFPLKRQDAEAEEEGSDKRFNRNNKTHQQLQRAFNWVKTYEDKIFQVLAPESVDLRKIGGKPLEDGLDEMLKNFVKQEDESKFRCKVPNCSKLFKGEDFWRKHVEKRHEDWFDAIKKDVCWSTKTSSVLTFQIDLINAYAVDPAHVVPPRSDQQPQNSQFPRSVSVQAQAQPGYPNYHMQPYAMPPAYPPAYQPYPPPYAHPMHMPGPMYPPPYAMPMGMGPGPMRRAPGGRAPRPANPYERPMGAGRGMPSARGRMMSGPPRFPDAAGGGVGSQEAVQGRSLKSYEDLDAAGGNAGGELDY